MSAAVGVTDFFVIGSGRNDRQVKALVENVEDRLRVIDLKPLRREGVRGGRWALLDYGDFVVHIFLDEARGFYDLERLWADAPRIHGGDGGAEVAQAGP